LVGLTGVDVGLGLGNGVAVGDGVGDAAGVGVGVGDALGVGTGVGDELGVAFGEGSLPPCETKALPPLPPHPANNAVNNAPLSNVE